MTVLEGARFSYTIRPVSCVSLKRIRSVKVFQRLLHASQCISLFSSAFVPTCTVFLNYGGSYYSYTVVSASIVARKEVNLRVIISSLFQEKKVIGEFYSIQITCRANF